MAPTSVASRLWSEQRAVWELGAFGVSLPWFSMLPRGDGHPVLVLPGFGASDQSTAPLRQVLRALGHDVQGWRLGRNTGADAELLSAMADRLAELYRADGRPVSLVGWSLGGIYARGLARHAPHQVRQVITLGSPFRMFEQARGLTTPPVPVTAVYSKTDAVVPWGSAQEDSGRQRESVEVRGSHLGLGHNPAVVVVVADRLAQDEGSWKPFRPAAVVQHLYPRTEGSAKDRSV
jgi:pimeloyl-ACP methyl ester carboxylesterase